MRVNFYALLRPLAGTRSATYDLPPGSSLRQLITAVVAQYPEMQPHLLDENGRLRPDVPIFVDGRNPRLAAVGIETPLAPDAEVSIFSPISSGKMNVEVMR